MTKPSNPPDDLPPSPSPSPSTGEPPMPRAPAAADASEPPWLTCGAHAYRSQGDVLHFRASGPMELADITRLFEQRQAIQRQHGQVFTLIEAQHIGNTPADARRYAAEYRADPPFRGAVILLGAGLLTRTVVSLVSAAARLLGRSEKDLAFLFFAADLAEAAAIIARQRQALAKAAPGA